MVKDATKIISPSKGFIERLRNDLTKEGYSLSMTYYDETTKLYTIKIL